MSKEGLERRDENRAKRLSPMKEFAQGDGPVKNVTENEKG